MGECGQGGALELEDKAADGVRVEFDNDGGRGGVFLGGDGEGTGEDEVAGRDGIHGNVTSLFRSIEDRADDLTVDDVGDLGGWSGGGNGESVYVKGVRAK